MWVWLMPHRDARDLCRASAPVPGTRFRQRSEWPGQARLMSDLNAFDAHRRTERAVTKVRYGVSGSIWTILLVCWPSVHMLERTLGFELFCTSIWRVLMEVGRR